MRKAYRVVGIAVAAAVLFGCGGGTLKVPAVAAADQTAAGMCTVAAGNNQCTFEITTAFAKPPICVATLQGNPDSFGAVVTGCTVSRTTVTVYLNGTNSLSTPVGAMLTSNPNP